MNTNILVLAAGQQLNLEGETSYPTCLAEIGGVSLLEMIIVNTLNIRSSACTFAFLKADISRYRLDKVARLLRPDARIVPIPRATKGSACSALIASCQLPQEDALLIISANELVDLDHCEVVKNFVENEYHGGVLTFKSVHPRYSYVKLHSSGLVIEAAQQDPISQTATAGVFWFRRTEYFVQAAMSMIRKSAFVGDSFYLAPTYNELILRQMRVGAFSIGNSRYRPLKTSKQADSFERGPVE